MTGEIQITVCGSLTAELDKTCHCGHSGHDHEAGECWAEVNTDPLGRPAHCACTWWEPTNASNVG